jgi:hypothetical protein
MVQSGRGSGFPAKAFQRLRVFCHVLGEEFKLNKAAEFDVFRLGGWKPAATAQGLR